jgi:hypothetical protein
MHRPPLTDTHILLMLEMCLDAEERCDQRVRMARMSGDFGAASQALKLREQYSDMKHRLHEEIRQGGTTTEDLHEQLQSLPNVINLGRGRSAS